jgi:hypothetical protein
MNKAIQLVSEEFNISIPEYTVVGFPYENFLHIVGILLPMIM